MVSKPRENRRNGEVEGSLSVLIVLFEDWGIIRRDPASKEGVLTSGNGTVLRKH